MFTRVRNVQILISLLKQHGITKLVLSPGARNIPFVHSVEEDPFFTCYSVVDERSAAYFALGLSIQSGEPVAVSCTSSTATCNYTPAVAEAYYQGIPLILLTADKTPQLLDQMDPQHINQVNMYGNFIKKAVDVPIADNPLNEWYANRVINEGLIAATNGALGPVQINYHISEHSADIGNYVESIPVERMIQLEKKCTESLAKRLRDKKKILILTGQNREDIDESLNRFASRYNCCVLTEPTSNIHCDYSISGYNVVEFLDSGEIKKLCPDLIITMGGNWVSYVHTKFEKQSSRFEHWSIRNDGKIVDCFHSLTELFEINPKDFFNDFAEYGKEWKNDGVYFREWKQKKDSVYIDDIGFSNVWVAGELVKVLPKNAVYHTGILNSTRDSFFYDINPEVYVHSNIGTDGIDGSLSTFLGASMVTERPCFLLFGDLSFFYDMGALGIRGLKNNVHILVVNNKAGAEFHLNIGIKKDSTLNLHTAASHNHSVKGWVESLGYEYLTAQDKKSFKQNLAKFISTEYNSPVVFEVFTDADLDGEVGRKVMSDFRTSLNNSFEGQAKQKIKQVLGENTVRKVKDFLGK